MTAVDALWGSLTPPSSRASNVPLRRAMYNDMMFLSTQSYVMYFALPLSAGNAAMGARLFATALTDKSAKLSAFCANFLPPVWVESRIVSSQRSNRSCFSFPREILGWTRARHDIPVKDPGS